MAENLAPLWDILINAGTRLPEGVKALVQSVTVEGTVDGADELTIVAAAYNPTGERGSRWALVGSTLLAPGNFAKVYAGYMDGADLPVCLQRFRLISEDVDYGPGSVPTVTIRGYSAAAMLAENTEPRAWEGPITDSAIVQEIADAYGLLVELEATPEVPGGRIKPRGESDLVFLRKLAVANGYGPPLIRYDEDQDADVLFFRPQVVDSSAALVFTYDPIEAEADLSTGNLVAFRASLDLHGVPTTILVAGWDPALQVPVVVTMKISPGAQDPVILSGEEAAEYGITGAGEFQAAALSESMDPRDELIESTPLPSTVTTVEDAVAWATRWVDLRARAFLTGQATVLGNPKLWAGQVHTFQGLAPTHVGLWEVLTATHRFTAEGYETSLDLSRVLEDASPPEEA